MRDDIIKVLDIKENEDGSALVELEMDPDTYAKIFNEGFVHLIKKGLESEE
tara:strand:- start:305 stop:457 length:153 start_codon:yes stop_codon:yes gene_type:complete